jgi:hypothetical protein
VAVTKARLWGYQNGLAIALDGGEIIINPPPPPPPPNGKVWWVGGSRATQGLNQSANGKQSDFLARIGQIAPRIDLTAAQLRPSVFYHGYIPGTNWNAGAIDTVQFARDNGLLGLMQNQGIPDRDVWAAGGYDASFLSYLKSITAISTALGRPFKFVPVFEHEPENDASAVARAPAWCQGTARFMKITAEYNDPNIIYSTCHIPGSYSANWNPRPALNALFSGDTAKAQAVMNRTLCGLDPYPEIDNGGALNTLEGRCRPAINLAKSFGYTRFSMPEVALFNFKKNNTPGGLTAVQQATRLKNECWTWARANGFEVICYFDVTDVNNLRGDSRTLDTAEEQTVWGHIILNQTP